MKRFYVVMLLGVLALQGCGQETKADLKMLGKDAKKTINSAARDIDSKF